MTGLLRYLGRYLASIPVSVAFALLVVVTASSTGTLIGPASSATRSAWAASVKNSIDAGHWWSIATANGVAHDPVQLAIAVLAALSILGWAERLLGHRRTILMLLVTGLVGVGLGVAFQWVGGLIGDWWSAGTLSDGALDPLIPIAGTVLAASAFAGPLWRRRARVGGLATLLIFALYGGASADAYRLLAGIAGLILGAVIHQRKARFSLHRSSHTETRTLVALVVAISAIGPAISAINPNGYGVLSLFGWIFGDPFPTASSVSEACATESALACAHDQAFLALRGPGPIIMLFVPLALLLVSAYGLRRGKRFAWWLAIVVSLTLAALSFFYLTSAIDFSSGGQALAPIDIVELIVWVGGPVLVPIVIAVVLVITRRHFRLRSSRRRVLQFWVGSTAGLVTLSALYLGIAGANIGSFTPRVQPWQLLVDAPMRYLPVNFLVSYDSVFFPRDHLTRIVFHWVGPLFWILVVVGLMRVVNSSGASEAPSGEAEIRRLVKRGAGTLGFMATWEGNRYWFSADRESAFAYRLLGGVAITLSDPLCPPGAEREAIKEFIAYCDARGWIAAFYSVHEEFVPMFDELGWSTLPVGVETLMNPRTLTLTGKAWQNVRTPLNRGLKEGVRAEWVAYRDLPLALQSQIYEISEQWVAEKELPEMGFTLGGLEQLKDPEVMLMLAVGPDGRVQAVTSWLPVYVDGETVGWTLDFMRRADESMPGIMEFVIASAALRMQEDDIEVLSLSGAPLATAPAVDGEEQPTSTVTSRLLDLTARMLEPAYGFSALFKYKAKFHPSYRTLYMAYRDPLTLPVIGRALAGAYLPDLTPGQTISLVRTLVG